MFADPLDVAAEETTKQLEVALANRVVYTGKSAEHCADCGEEIPEARRLAVKGVQRCIFCQTKAERK